jgi:serine/threonine-protein kinase RsbW
MIETEKKDNRWRCRFSATLENIDSVDDLFARYINSLQIPVDIFGLRILMREALLNAVTHGSQSDPEKTVDFIVETDNTGIDLIVRDTGEGFAWRDHQAMPTDLCESGRGLALMRIYSDNISYNKVGNIVSLRKNFKVAQSVPR